MRLDLPTFSLVHTLSLSLLSLMLAFLLVILCCFINSLSHSIYAFAQHTWLEDDLNQKPGYENSLSVNIRNRQFGWTRINWRNWGGKREGTSLAVQTEKSREEQISVCLMCCSVTWMDVGFLPCSVCWCDWCPESIASQAAAALEPERRNSLSQRLANHALRHLFKHVSHTQTPHGQIHTLAALQSNNCTCG